MDIQNLVPTLAHTTATLVGLMATAAGARSILAPRPFAESFGFPQKQSVDPFIPVVGVRNIGLGLSLLAFSTMKNTQAMGVVLLCNLASMVGDTVICWKKGCTQKSINSHLIASVVFAILGGYLSLSA